MSKRAITIIKKEVEWHLIGEGEETIIFKDVKPHGIDEGAILQYVLLYLRGISFEEFKERCEKRKRVVSSKDLPVECTNEETGEKVMVSYGCGGKDG